MNQKSTSDITWKEEGNLVFALISGEIVGAIRLPNEKCNYFQLSSVYEKIRVREKFRENLSLEGMQQSIIAAYLGTEEKPDDIIVSEQMKAWNGNEWLLSAEDYEKAKIGFRKVFSSCASRFGGAVSHGADIAGRTEAAVYLTSVDMTANGYVLRLAFWEDEVSKVGIDDAPQNLHITRTLSENLCVASPRTGSCGV